MNSTDTQFIFSNEIRERVDPQTRSVMDVFEKQLVSPRSTIDQIPEAGATVLNVSWMTFKLGLPQELKSADQ